MSHKLTIGNTKQIIDIDSQHWDIICENIYKSYLNFIIIFYNINVIDEEPGTIRYYNLTKLKSIIDKLQSNSYDFLTWSNILEENGTILMSVELHHILYLNFNPPKTFNIYDVQSIQQLISYCVPFIKDTDVLKTIYSIDDIFISSIENNLSTFFELTPN